MQVRRRLVLDRPHRRRHRRRHRRADDERQRERHAGRPRPARQPARPPAPAATSTPPRATLRQLAQHTALRIGTAVDMTALANDATYRRMVGEQFSTVTPENVMKWEVVEPQRGQYDFSAGRRARPLRAGAPPEGARPHPGLAQPAAGMAHLRHLDPRPAARHPAASTSSPRSGTSAGGSGPGTSSTRRSTTTAACATRCGRARSARATSLTPSDGPTRPTRRRSCSTTTTTSRASTRRARPSTTSSSACARRACRSRPSASRGT